VALALQHSLDRLPLLDIRAGLSDGA